MNGERWSWHGAVALVLALGIVIVLVEISGPWDPDPLSDTGANVLLTLIGALATYLGVKAGVDSVYASTTAAKETLLEQSPAPERPADWSAEVGSDERMDAQTLARIRQESEKAEAERRRKRARRGE
jgi:hypothetical protein